MPPSYKEVTELYAKEQYYVLAVGMKELGDAATVSVMGEGSDRNSLENGLTLLGLLLFRNEVMARAQLKSACPTFTGLTGVRCLCV